MKIKKIVTIATIILVMLGVLMIGVVIKNVSSISLTGKLSADKLSISSKMLNKEQESGIINVAVFGLDNREHTYEGDTRSDAIKVVSLDTVEQRASITSFQRDILVNFSDDEFGLDKLNHAYWYGGAELTLKTLNYNFDLDLSRYITINYDGVEKLIDQIGGIEIELLNVELKNLNENILDLNGLAGWENQAFPIEEAGVQILGGRQAVAFMRIRTIGSDYARMNRQTLVMRAVAQKLIKLDYSNLLNFIYEALSYIETNIQVDEIIKLLPQILSINLEELKQDRIPKTGFDETIAIEYKGYNPVYLLNDYIQSVMDVHEIIYEETYLPIDRIKINHEEIYGNVAP